MLAPVAGANGESTNGERAAAVGVAARLIDWAAVGAVVALGVGGGGLSAQPTMPNATVRIHKTTTIRPVIRVMLVITL